MAHNPHAQLPSVKHMYRLEAKNSLPRTSEPQLFLTTWSEALISMSRQISHAWEASQSLLQQSVRQRVPDWRKHGLLKCSFKSEPCLNTKYKNM